MGQGKDELLATVEAALATRFPQVELVDLELRGGGGSTLVLYIDAPGGVDLDLCAEVAGGLDELRERYALEVSSPGLERPLRTAAHFAAAVGRDVALRLRAPRDGRSNFRGRLAAADDQTVTLALSDGPEVRLDLADVARAHVVYHFEDNGGQRE